MRRKKTRLSNEDEAQLKRELTFLWNSRTPVYTIKEIVQILKVGVVGTRYAELDEHAIWYYRYKFGLRGRGRFVFSKNYKPKKVKKVTPEEVIQKPRIDMLKLAEEWQKFDGSWSEFKKAQCEKSSNIADESELEMKVHAV
jgi:hypothetical protein